MRKTYQEIMENIEVTPDMRERILKNIQQPEVRKASSKYRGKTFQRWYPAAACVALLLCAALELPRLLSPDTGTSPDSASSDTDFPGEEQTTIVNGMVSYDSAAALSAALGFPVEDLAELPFTPDTVSIWTAGVNMQKSPMKMPTLLSPSEKSRDRRISPATITSTIPSPHKPSQAKKSR